MPERTGQRDHKSSQRNFRGTPNGRNTQGRPRRTSLKSGGGTLEAKIQRLTSELESLKKALERRKKVQRKPGPAIQIEGQAGKQPTPTAPSEVGEQVKPEGTSGGSMTRSLSMGATPRGTLPLRPTSTQKPQVRRESTGRKHNGAKPAGTGAEKAAKENGGAKVVEEKKMSKRRHGYRSDQTDRMKAVEESAIKAVDDQTDKPVLSDNKHNMKPTKKAVTFFGHQVWSGREARLNRRKERHREVEVSTDLYWYLRLEFLFVPRTADSLRQMKSKAKQFLSLHDTNGMSLQEQFSITLATIRAVMEISKEEEEMRQSLKNPGSQDLRTKHADLTTKGVVGESWFGWGKSYALPQQPRA